jgi:hypothetical protein
MINKVAIVSCYYHHNYGSMLQAYATQRLLDSLSIPNETIACMPPITYMVQPRWMYYCKKIMAGDWALRWGKLKIAYYKKKYSDTVGKSLELRDSYFDNFIVAHMRLSACYHTRNELISMAINYSAFLVGSDQLWRMDSIEHGYYTLEFVPENKVKIAYATSFGMAHIPFFQQKKTRQFLNRFNHIAVREDSAKVLIKCLTGRNVPVVLDPSLLLNEKQWSEVCLPHRIIHEPYILCYFLGNNLEHRKFAKRIKQATGLKILSLLHLDTYVKEDEETADIMPFNIGPSEFINLVQYADYVCTDSYHGTAFSIIYKKVFFTFPRFQKTEFQSTNTRLDTLLRQTNLENRLIDPTRDIKQCLDMEINYDVVSQKLNLLRDDSIKYLKSAFASLQ